MAHIITITESPATEPGALDGFDANCSECGPKVAGFSIRSMTAQWGRDHARYMESVGR